MTTQNWDELGITWTSEPVQRQHGDHASDRAVIGNAQIPTLGDLDKAIAAGLGSAVLAGVNGTSWRVKAQDVCRRLLEKDRRIDVDTMRSRVFERLRSIGVRTVQTVTVTVEKTIHPLPDGATFDGDNEMEYRAAYAASLIDQGVDGSTAQQIALKVKW